MIFVHLFMQIRRQYNLYRVHRLSQKCAQTAGKLERQLKELEDAPL